MLLENYSFVKFVINILECIDYMYKCIYKKNDYKKIKGIEYKDSAHNLFLNRVHQCYHCKRDIDDIMYCYKDNHYCSEECRNEYI